MELSRHEDLQSITRRTCTITKPEELNPRKSSAVDRGLWCIVLFGPGCPIQDYIRLHVVASKVLIRIAADGMDEWARKDAKTQREKTEGVIQKQ
jgi:hypothetical protein